MSLKKGPYQVQYLHGWWWCKFYSGWSDGWNLLQIWVDKNILLAVEVVAWLVGWLVGWLVLWFEHRFLEPIFTTPFLQCHRQAMASNSAEEDALRQVLLRSPADGSAFKYIWSWEMERVHSCRKKRWVSQQVGTLEWDWTCIYLHQYLRILKKDLSVDVDLFKLRCLDKNPPNPELK